MATLEALYTRAADGQGQVVGIVGEPGLGKTRLVAECWQRLGAHRVHYLEGRCVSYRQTTPYGPLSALLRHACGLTKGESPAMMTTAVYQHLQAIGLDPAETAPYLLPLLHVSDAMVQLADLSPQTRRARTFAALHQLLQQASHRQPLLVVVENLHWIDPTSEAYLMELVERLTGASLLLLVTFRPGYRPLWMDKSYATQLALAPLGAADSQRVVQAVLHSVTVPTPVVQETAAKAAGNPLFLEELAWTVREQGSGSLSAEVPETIQTVLTTRLDRLPPDAKSLLQIAAVIGLEVPVPLLQALAELPEDTLQQGLADLQAAEFLSAMPLFPAPVYTFKHALTHEVAYGSLLKERRRTLHARMVEILETLAPERAAEQVERLVHHTRRGEVWGKAVTYGQQAGARAHDRAAFSEAVVFFEQALQALAHLPESSDTRVLALELRLALGYTLSANDSACVRRASV